jgi:hypothetical protein
VVTLGSATVWKVVQSVFGEKEMTKVLRTVGGCWQSSSPFSFCTPYAWTVVFVAV